MNMRNLPYEEIVTLAKLVANDLGIESLNERRLLRDLRTSPPMPTIISSREAQLWVDRYYVAYSLKTEKFIHYVYISPEHAKEEMLDLPELILKCRNKEQVEMMRDIMQQLKKAVYRKKYFLKQKYKRRMESGSAAEN
ncbi:MAG: hypothetical protein M1552_01915 [Firmicutes bacterium]|nr:hypothetical protein [Bacillota bacterium]